MAASVDRVADLSRTMLGVTRLVNGSLGLVTPRKLVGRIDPLGRPSPAAIYAFRLFGVRTVLIGRDLLSSQARTRERAVREALWIHATDTATAVLLTTTRRVPPRVGVALIAVSGTNTLLAIGARRRPRNDVALPGA